MVNIDAKPPQNSLAIYTPSEDQLKLRAIFQTWLEDNALNTLPFEDKVREALAPAEAERVIKLAEINPEFKRWFMTGGIEFRVRLRMLELKSMTALEDVLANDDPKAANARVNAAKYVLEMAGKSAKTLPKASEKLEEAISRMSELELKALMESEDTETSVEIKKTKKKVIDI